MAEEGFELERQQLAAVTARLDALIASVEEEGISTEIPEDASPVEKLAWLEEAFLRERARCRLAETAQRESETQLHSMLDNAPTLIYVKDLHGRLQLVNRKFAQLAQCSADQLIGLTEGELFPGHLEVAETIRANEQQVIERNVPLQFEETAYLPDGEHTFVSVKFPMCDADGRIIGIGGISTDITERKQVEEALHIHEELARLFIKHVPAAVAMFDREMRYIAVSRRWLTDYHLGERDIIGLSHYEVFPEIDERWKAIHRRALAGMTERCEEDPFPRADGTLDWVRWEVVPWYRTDGSVGGIIIFTEVITERKRFEEALQYSEEMMKRAQEIAHLGSWELDLLTNHLTWSDEVYRIFGLQPQEFKATYEAFLDAVHPDDRAAVDAAYSGSLREGRDSYEIEHRVVRKSTGELRIVHEKCDHIRDDSGRIVRSVGMVHDITERKRAEAERERLLTEVEHRAAELDATLDSMADGLAIYDVEGRLLRKNATADQVIGYVPSLTGEFAMDRIRALHVTKPDGLPLSYEETASYQAMHGKTVHGVIQIVHHSDHTLWLSVSAAPIRTANGTLLGAVVNFTDITKLHELQETERRYLYTVAHDLRAPVTIINGQIHLLLELLSPEELTGPLHANLEAIQRTVRRMNTMIDNLTEVTRLEEHSLSLAVEPVFLADFMHNLLRDNAGIVDVTRIQVEVPANLPPVAADPRHLERIFLNLLLNAEKYSPPAAPIRLCAIPHADEVEVHISDQGQGIPPEDLPHIFDRFYRAARGRKAEGIGLGLYIARLLVEAHGGHIRAESEPGKGSTFIFTLPWER